MIVNRIDIKMFILFLFLIDNINKPSYNENINKSKQRIKIENFEYSH